MNFSDLLKRLRLRPLEGEGERPVDNVDGLTTAVNHSLDTGMGGGAPVAAPPNWVPSQQDDRPRH